MDINNVRSYFPPLVTQTLMLNLGLDPAEPLLLKETHESGSEDRTGSSSDPDSAWRLNVKTFRFRGSDSRLGHKSSVLPDSSWAETDSTGVDWVESSLDFLFLFRANQLDEGTCCPGSVESVPISWSRFTEEMQSTQKHFRIFKIKAFPGHSWLYSPQKMTSTSPSLIILKMTANHRDLCLVFGDSVNILFYYYEQNK